MAGDVPPRSDDSLVFAEQARWLLQWHNARSESLASRAVAVLGFDGVIMALLLQGFGLKGLHATAWVWILLIATALLLLTSAGFAVATILPHKVAMPQVQNLRQGWATHAASPTPHYAGPFMAESLLNASDLTKSSPLASAKSEGDLRANRFSRAVSALLAAIVCLGLLAVVLLSQL
jgi:hypothetical protein